MKFIYKNDRIYFVKCVLKGLLKLEWFYFLFFIGVVILLVFMVVGLYNLFVSVIDFCGWF